MVIDVDVSCGRGGLVSACSIRGLARRGGGGRLEGTFLL